MVLLIAMAFDRYVAICRPLHYLLIMNFRTYFLLGYCLDHWDHPLTFIQILFVVNLPFCGPNKLDSFYCRSSCLLGLPAWILTDWSLWLLPTKWFHLPGSIFILITSYIFILVTVWQHFLRWLVQGPLTVSSHCSGGLIFRPMYFVYSMLFPTVPVDKFLAIFDVVIIFLNPAIHSLRAKRWKVAMRRIIQSDVEFQSCF